ncbi:hypothetical protein COA01_23105 [Bacillus cereus]|uniref:hypothetical protein n=1 Tax=Bacillus cereus TaxID=1396 RepID=UPI000BFC5A1A|nr:hypothetical protein [Bacillus cereus]PGP18634.1 hypothetical protein COA01_23105 [Bacillus cereus]
MSEWITNTLGIPVLPPEGEFITFQNEEERQLFVEKYDMAKYRTKKQGDIWLYKGRSCPFEGIACELVGYQKNGKYEQLIIGFSDSSTHKVMHLKLRQMQNNKYDNTIFYEEYILQKNNM